MAGKKPNKDGEGGAPEADNPSSPSQGEQPTPSNSENSAEKPDTGAVPSEGAPADRPAAESGGDEGQSGAPGDAGASASDEVPPEAGGDPGAGDAPAGESASESSSQALSQDGEGADPSVITDAFDKARATGVQGSVELPEEYDAEYEPLQLPRNLRVRRTKQALFIIGTCVALAYPGGNAPALGDLPDWVAEICSDVVDELMLLEPTSVGLAEVTQEYNACYARISRRDHGDNSPFKV